MIEREQEQPHICLECDAEFVVHTPFETDDQVSFCPFCGSEVDPTEDELDEDFNNDLFDDEDEQ